MKILAVSDVELGVVYSPHVRERFPGVDVIIGCGDLPYSYLEFMVSTLDARLYYVRGNHSPRTEHTVAGDRRSPWGGFNLHGRSARHESGLLLAGVEGCLQYNYGPHQYTQFEMWLLVLALVPRLLLNKIRYGRYLDVFVTHAPPWKIHDADDRPHRGVRAFRWLDRVFQPALHLHGHIHIYRQDTTRETQLGATRIINAYGYRELDLDQPYLKGKRVRKRRANREGSHAE